MVSSQRSDFHGAEPSALRVWSAPERGESASHQAPSSNVTSNRSSPSGQGVRVGPLRHTDPRSLDSRSPLLQRGTRSSLPSADSTSLPLSYFNTPDFSPHTHASVTLERYLPSLPARDADAAMAALDAVESELRNQRDAVRVSEEEGRDALRVALQASARVRAACILDADQAEEAKTVAEESGKGASKGLRKLLSPLRRARDEKLQLTYARDLAAVLSTDDSDLDALRAAEVLSRTRNELAAEEFALALFDGNASDVEKARTSVKYAIESLAAILETSVSKAAAAIDPPLIRLCIRAGSALGPMFESRIVKAAVDAAIVVPASEGAAVFSNILAGLSPDVAESSTWRQDRPGGSYVKDVLRRFVACQRDVEEAARDFASRTVSWFPNPSMAHLHAVSRLVEHFLVREGMLLLDHVEKHVHSHVSQRDQEAASPKSRVENAEKDPGSVQQEMDDMQGAHADTYQALTRARFHQLDIMASVAQKLAAMEVSLLSILGVSDMGQSRNAFKCSVARLQARVADYFELEKLFLEEHVASAFAGILLESQAAGGKAFPTPNSSRIILELPLEGNGTESEPPLQGEAYHRYRMSYLRVVTSFPDMTSRAVSLCRSAVERCCLAHFNPLESGVSTVAETSVKSLPVAETSVKSLVSATVDTPDSKGLKCARQHLSSTTLPCDVSLQADGAAEAVKDVCAILLRHYVFFAEKLLLGAQPLRLSDVTSDCGTHTWSSTASPLASVCKAIRYLFEAGRLVDCFFTSFEELAPFKPNLRESVAGRNSEHVDELCRKALDMKERRMLRAALRTELERLSRCATSGIEDGIELVGRCVNAMLDVDEAMFGYSSEDRAVVGPHVVFPKTGRPSYPAEPEPSVPFLSVSAFLEQQIAVLRSNLPPENLKPTLELLSKNTYETILRRWRVVNGSIGVQGGLQMVSDGEAVARVFGELLDSTSYVKRVPALGLLFSTPARRLGKTVESDPLAHVDAPALVDLIEKRVDSSAAVVRAARETLIASSQLATHPE